MVNEDQTDPREAVAAQAKAVLVVEDDPKLLANLVESLAADGFAVLPAGSAAQACELLATHRIALVLLDWNLVDGKANPTEAGTGALVLRTARQIDPLVPVIVMSGVQTLDVRTDAVMTEADSFVAKPFSLALVTSHLRHWMDRMEASRPFLALQRKEDILPFQEVKRRYIQQALRLLGDNVAEAARLMKLHRHTVAPFRIADAGPAVAEGSNPPANT